MFSLSTKDPSNNRPPTQSRLRCVWVSGDAIIGEGSAIESFLSFLPIRSKSNSNLKLKPNPDFNFNSNSNLIRHRSPGRTDRRAIPSSAERPRSVSIGGTTIIGQEKSTAKNGIRRITSIRVPNRATTLSSLDCPTATNNDDDDNNVANGEDLEAAQENTSTAATFVALPHSDHFESDNDENDTEADSIFSPYNGLVSGERRRSPFWNRIDSPDMHTHNDDIITKSTLGAAVGEKRKSFVCDNTNSTIRHAQFPTKNIVTADNGGSRHQGSASNGLKRRRLSKRARTRLTMREVNTHIPFLGRSFSTIESMHHFEKRKTITIPKIIDFFRRIEMKLIFANVILSMVFTAFVLHACGKDLQDKLQGASHAINVLGAFLSFALVFRTQTCYARWWEARTQWGRMTSACVHISGQARSWFGDDDLVDNFLTHCIVFPYSCKAVLRGNQLNDSAEEGPRFLHCGMLTDADLGVIIRHGRPPFACLEIMRHTMYQAFQQPSNNCRIPPSMYNGALLAMEEMLWELNLNFGACMKINGLKMPASYTIFMRSFIIFFFILASLSWAPTTKWLTPIIAGFMVFLINTVIVIGDQMMCPFDLQWSGLPLQKFCVVIEHEIMSVSRRQQDILNHFVT